MVDPISSCMRSLLIASMMMMMMTMMMTMLMTGWRNGSKRLYRWWNESKRRRYKYAGAASRVLKPSKIETRGALGCRLSSASRVQGRSGGVPKIWFFKLLETFGRFWIPCWRLLDFEGSPNWQFPHKGNIKSCERVPRKTSWKSILWGKILDAKIESLKMQKQAFRIIHVAS